MAKRKKTKTTKESGFLHIFAWTMAIIAVLLSAIVSGYYFGYQNAKEDYAKKEQVEKQKKVAYLKKLEETSKKQEEKTVNEKLQDVLKKEEISKTLTEELPKKSTKEEELVKTPYKEEIPKKEVKTTTIVKESINYVSASHEVDDEKVVNMSASHERKIKKTSAKPRIAIIIDDVGTAAQVKAIKGLSIPITMAFLPPSSDRPHSAELAAKEKLYMVHLPMEAMSFSAEEPSTLRINDSQEKISARIKEIKKLFPKVKYINNHTGSKFTADEEAMSKLFYALKENEISFIDSRTTATTKAPKLMKGLGLNYVSRDIFLDHQMDKPFIRQQIQKVIAIAKKHGNAVAIGHPHANTIATLHESKKLFEDVELVYINKL